MELIYNSIFLEHDTGEHPENASRLKHFKGVKETDVPNGEKYLELAHSRKYIDYVIKRCEQEGFLDADTLVSKRSYEVACYAVGATIMAAEQEAFALVRPPGHHACADRGMGFCIFNNIAITTKYLVKKGKNVFVFDFDLHHGNGTQEILEGEPNTFYFSLHQSPCYPGTGRSSGKNYINIPLQIGTGDEDYIKKLEGKLLPALEKFKPDIVGVSAGFDSYHKDFCYMNPGAGFRLTEKSYEKIKEILKPYKTFYVLEGGYNPESIKEGVDILIK